MPTHEKNDQDPRDLYLEWGITTGFRFFFAEQRRALPDGSLSLLIKWASLAAAARGKEIAKALELHIPGIYTGGEDPKKLRSMWAVSVPIEQIERFVDAAISLADTIELAAPVSGSGTVMGVSPRLVTSTSEVLAAVLDDGCAFANLKFLQGNSTRVLWLWNQDPTAAGFELDTIMGPSKKCDFGYGGQWSQDDLNQMIQQEGSQEPIYVRAGLAGLRRAAAHGTHVMDLLCGAEDWQIVFVQFPLSGINDPSGLWLKRYAFEGIQYILECAGPHTKKIVVNLSWGPQTGPHDGSSFLEAAIDEFVVDQQALGKELIVSVPAGNSFGSRAHAQIDYKRGGRVHWIVPPDGHMPAFFEVWWPKGMPATKARLRVKPPRASAVDIKFGMPWAEKTWFARLRTVGASAKALVAVHPTEHDDATWRGDNGQWTIEFDPGDANLAGDIHVYVARADHNMGAQRRARSSYLTDNPLEQARFKAPEKRFEEAAGSCIKRAGTLNGLCTGAETKVAAGYRYTDFEIARYSSSGPSRGARIGPDHACVTDQSAAIAGIRASGVRSGTTLRLVGTSTAAPQLGRQIANSSKFLVGPAPPLPERVGAGFLKPDIGVIRDG